MGSAKTNPPCLPTLFWPYAVPNSTTTSVSGVYPAVPGCVSFLKISPEKANVVANHWPPLTPPRCVTTCQT